MIKRTIKWLRDLFLVHESVDALPEGFRIQATITYWIPHFLFDGGETDTFILYNMDSHGEYQLGAFRDIKSAIAHAIKLKDICDKH